MQNCPFNCFFINICIYSMGSVSIKNYLFINCTLHTLVFDLYMQCYPALS